MVKEKTDDDITLDFSWLKNILPKKTDTQESTDEDVTLDLSKTSGFLKKYAVFFLLLIPIILSIHIRTLPANLPMADDWARQGIYTNIRNNVAAQVNQQYPHLPDQTKQSMIDEQFALAVSQQQVQIEQAVVTQAEGLKQRFRDESGETYLGDIDSYFWTRYANNLVEKGIYADEFRDGEPYDNHMSAPNGLKVEPNLYPYLEAYLYKFLRLFNPKVSILKASFLTPLFLSFFAIIAAFFIGKKLSGDLAGFIASILIAVNPTVLSRSLGSDNDVVNAVFPLLIMLFTIYAFDSKNTNKTIIYAAITGLLTGLYSFAWSGWWFMFLFIIGAGVIYMGYIGVYETISKGKTIDNLLSNKKLKLIVVLLSIFLASTFISLTIFGNSGLFLRALYRNPVKIVTIQQAARGISIWPNVYTTVAELNAANFPTIASSLGGKTFLWLALIGTILALVNFGSESKKTSRISMIFLAASVLYYLIFIEMSLTNNFNIIVQMALLSIPLFVGLLLSAMYSYKLEPIHSILMVIWFMATIYAATKGIRFILLIIPAFVISFSTLINSLVDWTAKLTSKSLDLNISIPKVIFTVIALLLLVQPIRVGRATAYSYVPSVNDAWVETLTKIKTESAPDAIVNSWWDFGHWFKYWADRQVTFDGASQNSQQAHWIGKVLLTDDEDQAVAILRMLDCGGIKAEQKLTKLTEDTYETVQLLYSFFEMTESEVKTELLKLTDQTKADEIVSYMFCEPPENYFITSGDMVGKSGVWAHFGSWNFQRAKIYSYFKSMTLTEFSQTLTTEFGYTEQDAQRIFYELTSLITDREINNWIAPWPSYGGVISCSRDDRTLTCNVPANNQNVPMQINLDTKEASVESNNDQTFHPYKFAYLDDNNELITKTYNENHLGYGLVLLGESSVLFMAPELTGSMFTRMFYLDGRGLNYFNKFHDTRDIAGSRIITWKLDWQ